VLHHTDHTPCQRAVHRPPSRSGNTSMSTDRSVLMRKQVSKKLSCNHYMCVSSEYANVCWRPSGSLLKLWRRKVRLRLLFSGLWQFCSWISAPEHAQCPGALGMTKLYAISVGARVLCADGAGKRFWGPHSVLSWNATKALTASGAQSMSSSTAACCDCRIASCRDKHSDPQALAIVIGLQLSLQYPCCSFFATGRPHWSWKAALQYQCKRHVIF
jgi:hypothetical protein